MSTFSGSEALIDEFEAINAIYGDSTLIPTDPPGEDYILQSPESSSSIRIRFPQNYPDEPPVIIGSEASGEGARKGEAAETVHLLSDILKEIFIPGEVCLFALLEEFGVRNQKPAEEVASEPEKPPVILSTDLGPEPPWILSDPVTEKKSLFLARAAPVTSTTTARQYISHLVSTDRRAAKATHNITAWRIRSDTGAVYQDCDDDGETAAGSRLLHLLQVMEVWDVVVVVSRWYGGIKLGPDRFRLINVAARDSLVRSGFVKEGKGK
jgi:hypothetical protein